MNIHWLARKGAAPNLFGHKNLPRISAETIVKLMQWKHQLEGFKRTILEEALIAEEKEEKFVQHPHLLNKE